MKNKKERLVMFLFFLTVLIGVSFYYYRSEYKDVETITEHVAKDDITFSHNSGTFHNSIEVELKMDIQYPSKAQIYYTLDGNDPTTDSLLYSEPIKLEMEDEITYHAIKAAIYKDGKCTKTYEKDYILDPDLSDFLLPIVCITTDEYNLYDKEDGIFSDPKPLVDERIANAHVTMFHEDGTTFNEQNVGLSVSGGTSVFFDIKSLKLTASYIYDESSDKLYFEDLTNDQEYCNLSFVEDYKSIKLRSGSQDMNFGNIRSAVMSHLAQESNFDGYSCTKRYFVVLNGELYGVYDMQQNYSNSFLKHHFALDGEDVIERFKGNEKQCFESAGIYDYFFTDLNKEENRKLLEKYVDMDNYLLYYAINILVNNNDWPANNYSAWHYLGEYDETNKYTDGRLRFLIFDTDIIYYTKDHPNPFEDGIWDNFEAMMSYTGRATHNTTFASVMKSDYYSGKLITILCDLMKTSFKEDHVYDIIDEAYAIVEEPMKESGISSYEHAEHFVKMMKNAVDQRRATLTDDFSYYFGHDYKYNLTLENTDGIYITWNNMELFENETYENRYYHNIPITYTATPYPGYEFKYWIVNGEKVYTPTMTILNNFDTNYFSISCVSSHVSGGLLMISEFSAKDDNDFFKLINTGEKSVKLNKFYITDTMDIPDCYQLPDITLEPGESIIINGKKNYYSIGNYICNFNLNAAETLYITDGKSVVDSVKVPIMIKHETYGRFENSPKFVYYNNCQQQRRVSDY